MLKLHEICCTCYMYPWLDCPLTTMQYVTVEQKIQHIQDWASLNKLSLNLNKTKKLVFKRPNVSLEIIPSAYFGVERLQCAKLLGVYFDTKLSFVHYVDFLIRTCSQRFYLLQQMRKQGLFASNL